MFFSGERCFCSHNDAVMNDICLLLTKKKKKMLLEIKSTITEIKNDFS